MKKTENPPPKRGYWYFITDYYCPICGASERYYEKRTDERPTDYHERHEFIESYDYCG